MKSIGLIILGALFLACQAPTGDTKANSGPADVSRPPSTTENPVSALVAARATSDPATGANPSDLAPDVLGPDVLDNSVAMAPPTPVPTSISAASLTPGPDPAPGGTIGPNAVSQPNPSGANVTDITVSGSPGSYSFSVTVQSPDTGCDQYADWWEVLSPEGNLIYRRVLLHSHVGEQPFTRSGGPVKIGDDERIIVRAHMNTTAYDGTAFAGSPLQGFGPATLEPDFASLVEPEQPLPSGCGG